MGRCMPVWQRDQQPIWMEHAPTCNIFERESNDHDKLGEGACSRGKEISNPLRLSMPQLVAFQKHCTVPVLSAAD
eukprot:1138103-Pelagomonas_calceolata.AAC.9